TLETSATLACASASTAAIAARSPAAPPPTMTTSCRSTSTTEIPFRRLSEGERRQPGTSEVLPDRGLLRKRRLLLCQAVHGAEPDHQVARGDPDHLAIGERLGERGQRARIGAGAEDGNEEGAVGEVEVRVARRAALAAPMERRRGRARHLT